MEGISVDGVVEIGHSLITDASDLPLEIQKRALTIAIGAMFGSIGDTVMWNIKEGVWMSWNLNMWERFGVNTVAQEIAYKAIMEQTVVDEEGLQDALDHIGGFVAILSNEEASLILKEFPYISGPMPRMFFLQGPTDGKGGGIGAVM